MIVIDMDMPKSCHECCCYDVDYQKCVIASKGILNRYHYDGSAKPQWCPTVCDIEQIRVEIEQIADEEQKHDEKWARGLHYALCIIDKYAK